MTCVSVCPRFDGSVTSPVSPMFGPCLLHRSQIRTVARKDPTRYKISSPSFPTSSVSTVMVTATSLMINDSCIGSPEEVTLLIDGAGLRQPLSLAQAPGSGPHSTLPTETAEPATAAEPVDPR